MQRVNVYIDGFNLYHALIRNFNHKNYQWCNLRLLAEQFADNNQKIIEVYFFTAYATRNTGKMRRHKKYVKALQKQGVRVILGNFKQVTRKYTKRMKVVSFVASTLLRAFSENYQKKFLPKELKYKTHEEKKTDVNLSVKIVEDAFENNYDHAFIISGDSDIIPAIKTVKKKFPNKKFTSILPIKSKGRDMQRNCNYSKIMTEKN